MNANIETLEYGEAMFLNGVRLSLHPAGHILGSSQVRAERGGEVAVVSGDYKTEPDRTCAPFEPIRCHTYVTESTFGLPIYRWPTERQVFSELITWQIQNHNAGRASILLGYSLGKSQRVLSGLERALGPIYLHPALKPYTDAYRDCGVNLAPTIDLGSASQSTHWHKATILAPPGFVGSPAMPNIGPFATAYFSGWMALKGASRGRGVDKGFVLSDHVDWPSLIDAVQATGAEKVFVTHGFTSVVVRYLQDLGLDAHVLPTGGEIKSELPNAEEGD
jgi:putative mRNA 3-end processing factor